MGFAYIMGSGKNIVDIKTEGSVCMKTRIACVQIKSELGDKTANLQKMITKLEEVCGNSVDKCSKVDLVVFPELAVTGYECSNLYAEVAEELPEGDSVKVMAEAARRFNVYIVYGLIEKDTSKGENVLYNTAVLLDKSGSVVGKYRKSHLVEGPETRLFKKGTEYPVFETDIGKIGMMICWDTAYPEVARILALKGAEIIVAPAAWESPYDEDWDIVQCARSFDNVVYVASCNHVGTDDKLTFFGKSKIVGPTGRTIVEAGNDEEIITAEVDLDCLPKLREGFYVLLKDRNPETYGEILNS